MIRFLQTLLAKCAEADGETRKVMRCVVEATAACGPHVLEVGCGYGRFLRPMTAAGLQATGIDINPGIVAANCAAGLTCMSPEEFSASDQTWDVILMAHVIEHFSPADLVHFMDTHLDRLQPGGRIIIATPLMSSFFYDDFDHGKPYQPTGIMMVFGEGAAQVQYYARNRLRLHDVWSRCASHTCAADTCARLCVT